jgi:membrane protease YdiL (CAAX protease family)
MPDRLARYGLLIAVVGFMVGLVASVIIGSAFAGITGSAIDSYGTAVAGLFGLWVGTLGVPLYASRRWGSGSLVEDYGLAVDWRRDLPIGVLAGVAGQFAVVPVLVGIGKLLDDNLKLSEASVQLAQRARGLGFLLFAVLVTLVAPVIEELFFRGLLQGSLARRLSPVVAVAVAGALFGFAHLQGDTALAASVLVLSLAAFGWILGALVVRAGRLGPAIIAHTVFNFVATVEIFFSQSGRGH